MKRSSMFIFIIIVSEYSCGSHRDPQASGDPFDTAFCYITMAVVQRDMALLEGIFNRTYKEDPELDQKRVQAFQEAASHGWKDLIDRMLNPESRIVVPQWVLQDGAIKAAEKKNWDTYDRIKRDMELQLGLAVQNHVDRFHPRK